MADNYNVRATLELDVQGTQRLAEMGKQLDVVKAKMKEAKAAGDQVAYEKQALHVKQLTAEYSKLQKAVGGYADKTKDGKSAMDKMSDSTGAQVRAMALNVIGVAAMARGMKALLDRQLELEGGTGALSTAYGDMQKNVTGLADNLASDLAPAFVVVTDGIGAAAKAAGWFINSVKELAGGLGSVSAGGSFMAGVVGTEKEIATQKKITKNQREQIDNAKEFNKSLDVVDKTMQDYYDKAEKAQAKRQDALDRELETQRALLAAMNEKADSIERESQRGDLGSGGFGENGGLSDFSASGLAGALRDAHTAAFLLGNELDAGITDGLEKTRDAEAKLQGERVNQANAALQLYQGLTAAMGDIASGNYGKGLGSMASMGADLAMPGSGAFVGMAVQGGVDTISGLASGKGPQRDQAIGGAIGFAVAGPVGMEVGKTISKVFGGKGAHVRIMNPEEIAANIHKAIVGEATSIGGAAASDASVAAFSGIGNQPGPWDDNKAATRIEEWRTANTAVAESIGLTIDRSMELQVAMEQGSMAASIARDEQDGLTDAQKEFSHVMGEENLAALIQNGASALQEYMDGVEKAIEVYNAGVRALSDFNAKTDRVIADISGTTDDWLAVERDAQMSRIAMAESVEDAIAAGNAALSVLAEQYGRNVAKVTAHIEDETKGMLETLTSEFGWFTGILGELLAVQGEKAQVLAAQEEARYNMARMRTSITGRYEEQNSEEIYGSLLSEFGNLRGGADLGNDRDVNRLMGILGEASSSVMSARSQSLIGSDVALERLAEIEKLQEEIFGAQLSEAGRKESTLSSSLVNSTFGQSMGLTMGENGIMLGGESITAGELQTRAQTFFQEEQTRIQTAQDEKLGRIVDFLTGIYLEQTAGVKDAVNLIADEKLVDMKESIDIAVDILVRTVGSADPDLAKKINTWYDRELASGQTAFARNL